MRRLTFANKHLPLPKKKQNVYRWQPFDVYKKAISAAAFSVCVYSLSRWGRLYYIYYTTYHSALQGVGEWWPLTCLPEALAGLMLLVDAWMMVPESRLSIFVLLSSVRPLVSSFHICWSSAGLKPAKTHKKHTIEPWLFSVWTADQCTGIPGGCLFITGVACGKW